MSRRLRHKRREHPFIWWALVIIGLALTWPFLLDLPAPAVGIGKHLLAKRQVGNHGSHSSRLASRKKPGKRTGASTSATLLEMNGWRSYRFFKALLGVASTLAGLGNARPFA